MYPAKVLARAACYQRIGVQLRVAGYHSYGGVGGVLLLYGIDVQEFRVLQQLSPSLWQAPS
jgi:hypothetical protein